jgi:hypothetical protein
MTSQSPRLALPFLEAGQAQKEIVHNEALAILDAATQAVAETLGDDIPPAGPIVGKSWIVGTAPIGDWAGHPAALATWTAGGWRFLPPFSGMTAWVAAQGLVARYRDGAWIAGMVAVNAITIGGNQVVGSRQPAIAAPSGGTIVDAGARAAIGSILAALRSHGLIAP